MLLRSSSTPVLGSLLSSFTDSPSNGIHCETTHVVKHLPPLPATSVSHHNNKLSLYQTGSLSLSSFSCNSSPISPSIADIDSNRGFRRAQSESNLEDLAYASNKSVLTLQTIASFWFSNYKGLREEDEEDEESEFEEGEEEEGILDTMERIKSMLVTEEVRVENGTCSVGFGELEEMTGGKEMYLAMGLGIEGCGDGLGGCRGGGGGGSGDYNSTGSGSGGDDGERQGVEEYYKRMVEENPGNPLFLRNYAQFLYQVSYVSLSSCLSTCLKPHYHSSNSLLIL